jgi:hypothetical protein
VRNSTLDLSVKTHKTKPVKNVISREVRKDDNSLSPYKSETRIEGKLARTLKSISSMPRILDTIEKCIASLGEPQVRVFRRR